MAKLRAVRAAAQSTVKRRAQIVQPTTRTYTAWNPNLIKAAEVQADNGNLRMVADLCDWILGDDRAKSCLDTRVQSLFGLDPTFERSGDKRRSGRAVRALEADEDWWDSYPEAENSLIVVWGILLGLGPAVHRWIDGGPDHDGRRLARPEFWHPRHIRYDWSTRRWVTLVAQDTFGVGTEQELVPGDGTWILHTPYGVERPWSLGLWRGLARLVLLKSYAQIDYARLGEAAARTVVESDLAVSDTKENREELASDIANCGRDGTIVLPPGYSYKLVEASAATKDIYDQQIKMANEAIAISLRGSNLSTNVQQGSRAAAESQQETSELPKLKFDSQAWTTTIHDQSLVHWAQINFGDASLAPWPVYPVEPKEDLSVRATALSGATTALERLLSLGAPVDVPAFLEEFEIEQVKQQDNSNQGTGQVLFQYHLDYGILTVNEARARLGLPPVKDGDERAVPSATLAQQASQAAEAKAQREAAKEQAKNPPAPEDESQVGDSAPPAPPNGKPAAAHAHRTILALSGEKTDGFVEGQEYNDDLGDSGRDHGRKAMAATVEDVLSDVEAATSYEDLKDRLLKRYDGMGPGAMAEVVEKATILAELAGRYAVLQDV